MVQILPCFYKQAKPVSCLVENSDSALQNDLRPLKLLMSNPHTQKNLIGSGWSPGHRIFRNCLTPLVDHHHCEALGP